MSCCSPSFTTHGLFICSISVLRPFRREQLPRLPGEFMRTVCVHLDLPGRYVRVADMLGVLGPGEPRHLDAGSDRRLVVIPVERPSIVDEVYLFAARTPEPQAVLKRPHYPALQRTVPVPLPALNTGQPVSGRKPICTYQFLPWCWYHGPPFHAARNRTLLALFRQADQT